MALTLTPLVLAMSKGSDWGWISAATLGCLMLAAASGVAFVAVERRVAVPLLDLSPLEAGLATLPATAGLVVVAPFVPRIAKRLGGRQVIGIGFADADWRYAAFVLPLVAVAVGMGLSNGPASGVSDAEALASGLAAASWVMAAAAHTHTLPTSATPVAGVPGAKWQS